MTVPEVGRTTSVEPARSAALDKQLAAERAMLHAVLRDILYAIPVSVVVLIGMLALALSNKQPWYVWTALGAVMGVYVAVFFGMLAGVMGSSHSLDVADEAAAHAEEESAALDVRPADLSSQPQETGQGG